VLGDLSDQKAAEGVKSGISTNWKDYGKGDVVVSHDGEDWTVDHAVGAGVYASSKEGDRAKALIKPDGSWSAAGPGGTASAGPDNMGTLDA
jgi:hypothetical protein